MKVATIPLFMPMAFEELGAMKRFVTINNQKQPF